MSNNILYIILSAFILVGCKKNKIATVQFSFQTELDGQAVDMTQSFEDSEGKIVRFELMKFYLSNISFTNEKNESIEVEEIKLLEINAEGFATFDISVPVGKYSAINAGLGVPADLNSQDPSNFNEVDNPLNITQSTFWGMNNMYRFVMLDGRYDLDQDEIFDGSFSYHTGHDDSYRTTSFEQNFDFNKGEKYQINFAIELSTILEGSGGNLDLVNASNYHGNTDDQDLSTMASDNFKNSISLK